MPHARFLLIVALGLLRLGAAHGASCPLQVQAAWIREPPPGAGSLAGYAVLSNTGTVPVTLRELRSPLFGHIQMHETMLQHGMAMMMDLASVTIPAGGSVRFEPEGRHFMLMEPSRALHAGERVPIELIDGAGCATAASFIVSPGPPR